MIRTYYLGVTTDGAGDGTVTVQTLRGRPQLAYLVEWVDGDFSDGVDAVLSITGTASGVDRTILTLTDANDDATYYVRELEQGNDGADLTTYCLPLISDSLKLVVSSGGATKTGGCYVHTVEL